jgi:hypothetical protein
MKKRILGLKIDTNRISWAIVEENISDLPQFPHSDLQYEIKEDKYIVDSSDDEVITFKIANFENEKDRQQFKNGILNKYRSLFGADSKEETGLCYMIYSDNLYSIDHKKLQTRAIHAMDWFIEVIK